MKSPIKPIRMTVLLVASISHKLFCAVYRQLHSDAIMKLKNCFQTKVIMFLQWWGFDALFVSTKRIIADVSFEKMRQWWNAICYFLLIPHVGVSVAYSLGVWYWHLSLLHFVSPWNLDMLQFTRKDVGALWIVGCSSCVFLSMFFL